MSKLSMRITEKEERRRPFSFEEEEENRDSKERARVHFSAFFSYFFVNKF